MLKIEVENKSIEKALKKYKNKARKTKLHEEVGERRYYKKKSVKRREEVLKAVYVEKSKND
ncbi:MAG: 30S ribosomal protein S21 [uncultured marine phage]|uniref:30S ribosomal protein S21 n=1 Tax=uncultured marine phage TaxID=707152 RepID=A0A8D9C9K4_9VIRU|nr:MAG: 30S ribosomal protein S21 [uncultured marine phage]